jgi:hypothetical protein
MTKAPQHERDERAAHALRFMAALNAAPRFNGVETLMPVALELRRVWARFYPHMELVFKSSEGNNYPI